MSVLSSLPKQNIYIRLAVTLLGSRLWASADQVFDYMVELASASR